MSIDNRNDFSIAATFKSAVHRQHLIDLELQGNNSVFTAFDDDNAGGRVGTRDDAKSSDTMMEFMAQMALDTQQRVDALSSRIDELDQAAIDALTENKIKLEQARADFDRIKQNAFKVTLPDGTVISVFRDGDKVRNADGAYIDVPVDQLPDDLPTYDDFLAARDKVTTLQGQRQQIIDYREKLAEARSKLSDDPTATALDALESELDSMPESVRTQLERSGAGEPRTTSFAKGQDGKGHESGPVVKDTFAAAVDNRIAPPVSPSPEAGPAQDFTL